MPASPSAFPDLVKRCVDSRYEIQGITIRVKNTFLDDVDYGSPAPAARRCSSAGPAMSFTEGASRTPPHPWQSQCSSDCSSELGSEWTTSEEHAIAQSQGSSDCSSELGSEGVSSEEHAIAPAEPRDASESDEWLKRPCKSKRDRCSHFIRYVERLLEEDPLADLRLLAPPAFISKSQWLQNKVHFDVTRALRAAGRNPRTVDIPWLPPVRWPTQPEQLRPKHSAKAALPMGANKWASN